LFAVVVVVVVEERTAAKLKSVAQAGFDRIDIGRSIPLMRRAIYGLNVRSNLLE
jgi:hypothetical protein